MYSVSDKKNFNSIQDLRSLKNAFFSEPSGRRKMDFAIGYLWEGRWMMLFTVLYLLSFYVIEHIPRLQYTVLSTKLDDFIPFVEAFIIPYELWFFYVVLSVIIIYVYDRAEFHRMATMLTFGMGLFIIVSAFWPNIQFLRPAEFPRNNIFTHMIASIYHADTPTNLCPSIHVYNSIVILCSVFHSENRLFRLRPVRIGYAVLCVLICLSTLFIKQHSCFDVTCAVLLAALSCFCVYRCGVRFDLLAADISLSFRRRRKARRTLRHI